MKRLTAMMGFAALLVAAPVAQAQEITLKVHHFLSPLSPAHTKLITPWCDKINKESGGKLKCQIYPAMQMGGTPPQLYDQAKDGVADIVWTLPGYTAGRFPLVEAFELPFMMRSYEGTSRALWDWVQANDQAEFREVHPIAFHVHGPGVFHMVNKPIKTLADFKGLKLRAPTRQTNKMLAAFGATPVGMPVPQLPEALSKGVIDGGVIPYEVVPSLKVQELVKFHSEIDPSQPAVYTSVFIYAMNKAKYDSLPPELKKVIDANSGAETSAAFGKAQGDADIPGRKLSEKNTFNTIPAAEIENWKKAAQPVIDGWVSDVTAKGANGKALLESARSLIEKYRK
jgi:TRAP-type C4-dicarboxylate transport system substrate-binding protein